MVIAGVSKGPHVFAIGEGAGNAHRFIGFVFVHDAGHIAQSGLNRVDGVLNQALAQGHQKQSLAVGGAFSVGIVHMVNEVFHLFAAGMPVANLAVVHESPILPNKGVAIAAIDGGAGGGTDMGKKQ